MRELDDVPHSAEKKTIQGERVQRLAEIRRHAGPQDRLARSIILINPDSAGNL